MKILNTSDSFTPSSGAKALPNPSPDLERVDALEIIVRSLLQRMQLIEERLRIEETRKASPAPPFSDQCPEEEKRVQATSPIEVDHAALKEGLGKMWKYLKAD